MSEAGYLGVHLWAQAVETFDGRLRSNCGSGVNTRLAPPRYCLTDLGLTAARQILRESGLAG